jgi:hypothetical protein
MRTTAASVDTRLEAHCLARICGLTNGWDAATASQLLRTAFDEIGALGDKLSPARAEALLDEFERAISRAFLRCDLPAVATICDDYARRFRALGDED